LSLITDIIVMKTSFFTNSMASSGKFKFHQNIFSPILSLVAIIFLPLIIVISVR
jgi:hypothetical protein